MKTKRFFAIVAAMAVMAAATIPASAGELTNIAPEGDTEVKAKILADDPGAVSYVIEIPDVVDFGTLQVPTDTTTTHNKDMQFDVKAIEINNLGEDERVNVYVKDKQSTSGNEAFVLDQIGGDVELIYDVYSTTLITDTTQSLNTGLYGAYGFFYVGFNQADQEVNGTLRLNQNQIKEAKDDGSDVVGEYKGYMTFYSHIV